MNEKLTKSTVLQTGIKITGLQTTYPGSGPRLQLWRTPGSGSTGSRRRVTTTDSGFKPGRSLTQFKDLSTMVMGDLLLTPVMDDHRRRWVRGISSDSPVCPGMKRYLGICDTKSSDQCEESLGEDTTGRPKVCRVMIPILNSGSWFT